MVKMDLKDSSAPGFDRDLIPVLPEGKRAESASTARLHVFDIGLITFLGDIRPIGRRIRSLGRRTAVHYMTDMVAVRSHQAAGNVSRIPAPVLKGASVQAAAGKPGLTQPSVFFDRYLFSDPLAVNSFP